MFEVWYSASNLMASASDAHVCFGVEDAPRDQYPATGIDDVVGDEARMRSQHGDEPLRSVTNDGSGVLGVLGVLIAPARGIHGVLRMTPGGWPRHRRRFMGCDTME